MSQICADGSGRNIKENPRPPRWDSLSFNQHIQGSDILFVFPWRSALKFFQKKEMKVNKIDEFSYSRITNPLYLVFGIANPEQLDC
jgi:hypothetical protein